MKKNNEVKQAYALSFENKQKALAFYEEAVSVLVNKNYVMCIDDAHTDLSAIFGQFWVFRMRTSGAFWLDAKLYAEANVAFNYANFTLGISNKFIVLAKKLVGDSERISDNTLKSYAKDMNSVLTKTTASAFEGILCA